MVRPHGKLRPQTMGNEGTKSIGCPKVGVRKVPARIRPELISKEDYG